VTARPWSAQQGNGRASNGTAINGTAINGTAMKAEGPADPADRPSL